MASSRSVTMDETFPRPLVIGYLGFDIPILERGRLGPLFSTQARLTGRPDVTAAAVEFEEDANSQLIDDWLNGEGNWDLLVAWLEQQNIDEDPVNVTWSAGFADVRARIVEEFEIQ